MIKYGTHANIENVEKKSTIIGPLSPLSPSFLTQVYAKPAHIPPAKPITAAAGGQFGVTAAYTYAPAREISVYDYTQIMFSAIMGLLVFGQLPDMLSFVGYCVIIAAGVIMFLYNKRRGGN